MRTSLTLLLLTVWLTVALASKPIKEKKPHAENYKKHLEALDKKLEKLKNEEAALEADIQEAIEEENGVEEDFGDVLPPPEEGLAPEIAVDLEDPCLKKFCGAGRECIISEEGKAECACVIACDNDVDSRRQVCSNYNETWITDCELYRHRCLCTEEEALCIDVKYKHMHIDYYGECQEMTECTEEEMSDFPRRMREWLFNIMRDMADRQKLSTHYLQLEKEAEKEEEKRWTYAVVWKWCDLDGHPKDKAISRHELFPIRAPLLALEHCISPFLNACDPNDDHFITLDEWISCLKIEADDVDKLEDLCDDLREEE